MDVTALAVLAVATGIALVRLGWSGRRETAALGWAAAVTALGALAMQAGAWGMALGAVAGMAVALACLLGSGGPAPVRPRRADRIRTVAMAVPEPIALARRLAVFLLVVPVGGAAALWLAFGIQAVARGAGMGPANANAIMLFLPPVLWCALLGWQLTRSGPRRMVVSPLLAAILGSALWAMR